MPIPPPLLADLTALRDRTQRDYGDDGLLFNVDGNAIRQSKSRTADGRHSGWFQRAAESVGLRDLHVHDLRHTTASLAISAGASPKTLQAMLGHSSAAMTLDTYAGLFEDDLDNVVQAMFPESNESTQS